jgi:putative SOS response-associated peptidase YedK
MCNLYTPASAADIARQFSVAIRSQFHTAPIGPRGQGWFVRRHDAGRELVQGRWGLIPNFAKEPDIKFATNNARAEELEQKPSFRDPWARSQRCIIPTAVFWEPCWESGKNEWWAFKRADGEPFALAGLWNTWVNRATGELHESYTMLTMNADTHPIMSHMHKPDPKLPPDQQDKRMVVVLEQEHWSEWLTGPVGLARQLITTAPANVFNAQPDPGRSAR